MGKIIGLLVAALLLIGGFLYWNSQSKEVAKEESAPQGAQAVTPTEKKGVASSIKEAMSLGEKMQCTYLMNEGDKAFESKVMVDGQKYASTTTIDNMTVYGFFDGETQYSWTSAAKTGTKMSKSCMEKMTAAVKDMPTSTETPSNTPQDMEKAFDMAKNVKCEAAGTVAVADFSIPSDITFTDSCALMEQSLQMMKDVKEKLPAGMTVPNMPAAY
ncbi:MAG: hypothetical protein ACEQSB_02490 [Undibacterium sp.]